MLSFEREWKEYVCLTDHQFVSSRIILSLAITSVTSVTSLISWPRDATPAILPGRMDAAYGCWPARRCVSSSWKMHRTWWRGQLPDPLVLGHWVIALTRPGLSNCTLCYPHCAIEFSCSNFLIYNNIEIYYSVHKESDEISLFRKGPCETCAHGVLICSGWLFAGCLTLRVWAVPMGMFDFRRACLT